MTFSSDTVYALSTGRARSGVAVIRVSGARAGEVLSALAGAVPPPRRAALRDLRSPTGALIDRALVLWFPGPHSFTGEDMAEFHVHGSVAVITALLEGLGAEGACRAADPGEFTRRAFAAGKLDLTEVEGLADLLAAETPRQHAQAVAQMRGALGAAADGWRREILRALAEIEARIDFSDEGDVPALPYGEVVASLSALSARLHHEQAVAPFGERIRLGYQVALIGPPNVGKSSLLNALTKREAAIVDAVPGTTRDVIEVALDIQGYPVVLADTAGLRDEAQTGAVEKEGMRRALARAAGADLVLVLGESEQDLATILPLVKDTNCLFIHTKSDVRGSQVGAAGIWSEVSHLEVSAKTGAGLETLVEAIADRLSMGPGDTEAPLLTRQRQRDCVARAIVALDEALDEAAGAQAEELMAESLRRALRALESLVGRVDVEDLLDVIFADFCIGK